MPSSLELSAGSDENATPEPLNEQDVVTNKEMTMSSSEPKSTVTGLDSSAHAISLEEASGLINWLRRFCIGWASLFTFENNKEAKAAALVHIPGGAVGISSSIFLSAALLELANHAAGCATQPTDGETELPPCHNRIYGFKPSSLLSAYVVVLGLTCSLFMPLVGAFMDSTSYRRGVGRTTALLTTLIVFVQSFISEKTWLSVALLQFAVGVVLSIHLCSVYAYIPELTNDETMLSKYNASISVFQNLTVVLFLVGMVGATTILGISGNNIKSARLAMTVAFVLCVTFYGYSWMRLFGSRPASAKPAEGKGVMSTGLNRVRKTAKKIFNERTELKWFLLSRSCTQAAVISLSAITVTYLSDDLQFTSSDVGVAILILLGCAIAGNKASISVTKWLNPLKSLRLCFVLFIVTVSLLAGLLRDPGDKYKIYSIAVIWGIALGWKEPTEKTLFCELVTRGHEAEMMGIYIFASNIFLWFPPLILTIMNEAGINMRIGIASIVFYFALGLACLLRMGDLTTALSHKKADEKEELEEEIMHGNEQTILASISGEQSLELEPNELISKHV